MDYYVQLLQARLNLTATTLKEQY